MSIESFGFPERKALDISSEEEEDLALGPDTTPETEDKYYLAKNEDYRPLSNGQIDMWLEGAIDFKEYEKAMMTNTKLRQTIAARATMLLGSSPLINDHEILERLRMIGIELPR